LCVQNVMIRLICKAIVIIITKRMKKQKDKSIDTIFEEFRELISPDNKHDSIAKKMKLLH
jgi:hypothetical protein